MADKVANLIIRLKDEASAGIDKLKGSVSAFAVATAALSTAIAALAGFKKIVDDTVKYGNEIDKANKVTGVSVETLERLRFAVESEHGSFDTLTNGLRFFSRAMIEATQNGSQGQHIFQSLGVSVQDAQGHVRDTGTVFLEFVDKFNTLRSAAEKNDVALRTFGRAGTDIIPFLELGRNEIERLGRVAGDLGVVLNAQTIKQIKQFDDSMHSLHAILQGVELQIGSQLIPALNDFVIQIIAIKFYMEEVQKTQSTWLETLSVALKAAGATFTAILDPLHSVQESMEKMSAGATASGDSWEKAMQKAKSAVGDFEKANQEGARKTTEVVQSQLQKRTEGYRNSFERTASFHDAMVDRMESRIKSFGYIYADIFTRLGDGIAQSFAKAIVEGDNFIDSFKQMGKQLLEFFIEEVIKQMLARWIAMQIAMGGTGPTGITGAGQAAGAAALGPAGAGMAALGPYAALAAVAYTHAQLNAQEGKGPITFEDLAFLPWTATRDVLKLVGLGSVAEQIGGVFSDIGSSIGDAFGSIGDAFGFAEGGVVLPRAGGTLGRIGEAGSPEAVIPLDDPRAAKMLGGSGETHIHIHAGTIVADNLSVRAFAKRIDEELYKRRKNGQSVAF